ncbi:restriction endonuclease subunit S [Klebsiella quasipneumoniae]|uniref:restriction endonuclease subunit S n=1 Tax=Klebsiella quasipneumoniae TaxID=1463165 RepID=UPI0018A28883|nr:restriction endonuclease subunit S [Klebsiella quasipneumoniae]MBF7753400.1 restriction endonuclease subunit S [Klebsiella quasipneumoniae]MBF7779946.1 restriction endonuclease subunit S [Klebsiella quasipneumoniae]
MIYSTKPISSGLSKPAKDFGTGYPFLSFKDIFYNYFLPDSLTQLVQSTDKERASCSVRRGDVFLTRTSETMHELGMSSVALKDYTDATFNGFCKRLRPKETSELEPEYVGYYLRSPVFRQSMLAFSTMSTRASLNNEMISRLEISYPDRKIQKKIANILLSLDEKIAISRAINQTLEQISQTLFKSWFVDFDPVIDNALDAGNPIPEALQSRAELRQKVRNSVDFKSLPADIRVLFPAEFEEMELGWIPKGWKEIKLSLLSKITSGKRPPSKFSEPSSINNVPVWGGNGIKWFTSEHLYNERYIITGRVGTLGTFYKVNGLSWPSDNALVIQPVNHELYELIYQSLQTKDILSLNVGSTQPLLTQTTLGNITFIIPLDRGLLVKFQSICDSFQEKISDNKINIEINTTLRDTLLPKLISGELSLEDLPDLVTQTEPA